MASCQPRLRHAQAHGECGEPRPPIHPRGCRADSRRPRPQLTNRRCSPSPYACCCGEGFPFTLENYGNQDSHSHVPNQRANPTGVQALRAETDHRPPERTGTNPRHHQTDRSQGQRGSVHDDRPSRRKISKNLRKLLPLGCKVLGVLLYSPYEQRLQHRFKPTRKPHR